MKSTHLENNVINGCENQSRKIEIFELKYDKEHIVKSVNSSLRHEKSDQKTTKNDWSLKNFLRKKKHTLCN